MLIVSYSTAPKQGMSTSQERFVFDNNRIYNRFNIAKEKEKMRQTNFKVGELKGGYDSCYLQ